MKKSFTDLSFPIIDSFFSSLLNVCKFVNTLFFKHQIQRVDSCHLNMVVYSREAFINASYLNCVLVNRSK